MKQSGRPGGSTLVYSAGYIAHSEVEVSEFVQIYNLNLSENLCPLLPAVRTPMIYAKQHSQGRSML